MNIASDGLVAAQTQSWNVQVAPGLVDADRQLEQEQQLLANFAQTNQAPLAMIWQSAPALIASQADRNLPRFQDAVQRCAAEGWPVYVRSSGGSAVALAPGVVNIGLIVAWSAVRPSIEQGFQMICTALIGTLARFGVGAHTGNAPGSFCDGRCNVLVNGRKIAGTSQRHASRGSRGALLVHATIVVDAAPALLTSAVARFYESAGSSKNLRADTVTSLAAEFLRTSPIPMSDLQPMTGRKSRGTAHDLRPDLPGSFIATLSDELANSSTTIR